MSEDPAFLFYPGDYLRDTQCLSEKTQAAYDRIMCEHMRNICISQQQLNFFTKRLSDDEKNELLHILKKITGGFQIQWVAESICKRKSYSESRAKNRKGKSKNISSTYDNHMEIENVIENENINSIEKSEKLFFILTKNEIENSIEYLDRTAQKKFTDTSLLSFWEAFKIQYSKEFYAGRGKVINHFRDWLKKQNHANKSNGKLGTSAARVEALRTWGTNNS